MLAKMTWNPADRQLRQFGACAAIALPILGWLFLGRGDPRAWSEAQLAMYGTLLALAVLAGLLAYARPRTLRWPFVGATLATLPTGLVLGELLLLVLFFGIFTPMAILFRLIRRDALQRSLDPSAASYWTAKTQATDAQQYFRQS
jgi:hypothetical protein